MTTLGTIATATVRGIPGVTAMYASDGDRAGWITPTPVRSWTLHPDDQVTDVQVLTAAAVTDAHMAALAASTDAALVDLRTRLAAARAGHAKPTQPTGRGAVVVDAEGREWVRAGPAGVARAWVQFETRQTGITWADIAAVRVLDQGVQP